MIETILCQTDAGQFFIPKENQGCPICDEILHNRVYDITVINAVLKYARKDSIVINAGACYGQMDVLFSKAVDQVYTFEANPDLCEIIMKNLEINKCDNVRLFNRAVWDKNDEWLKLPMLILKGEKYPNNYGSWYIDNNRTDGHNILSLTIDSLNLENVSAMKFDIQGADLRGMQGATQTIQRCKPMMIFEYEQTTTCDPHLSVEAYMQFVEQIGYKVVDQTGMNYVVIPK